MADPGMAQLGGPSQTEALLTAAAAVHTPESLGRAIISEALRQQAEATTDAPLEAKFSIKTLGTSNGVGNPTVNIPVDVAKPASALFEVCVFVGTHAYCVIVQPPIVIHTA